MSSCNIVRAGCRAYFFFFFFFFQAEDGIRDLYVTGVQTCALPILGLGRRLLAELETHAAARQVRTLRLETNRTLTERSEERRVGKSVDLGGRRIIKKKKRRSNIQTSARQLTFVVHVLNADTSVSVV